MNSDTNRSLLRRFDPDDRALFVWLAPRVTDAMLLDIAKCDHEFDAGLNFDLLVRIRDTAQVPVPLEWNPKEVLDLTRWADPESPEPIWPGAGYSESPTVERQRQRHASRAFACAVLIRAGSDPETADHIMSENSTLASLVDSAVGLGEQATLATAQLLAFAMAAETRKESDERVFFALAIVMLSAALPELAGDERLLAALLDWVEEERAGHWMNREFGGYSILELESSTREALWRRLAHEILIDSFVGTAAVFAPDGRFMHAARPPWRRSPLADRLVALGRSIAESRTEA